MLVVLLLLMLLLLMQQQLKHDDTNPVALESIMLNAIKNSRDLAKIPTRMTPHIMVGTFFGGDLWPAPRK